MREIKAGTVQKTVREAYTAAGGLDCVAADLGLSASILSRAIDASDEHRPGGLGINYIDRLSRIVPSAAVPIAEHFARLAGGAFEKRPETSSGCVHTLMSEFSDVLKTHASAMGEQSPKPGEFTPEEAKASLTEVKELRNKLDAYEAFLANCLNGN